MRKKYLMGIIALIAMILIPNSVSAATITTFDITSKLPLKIGEAKTDIENKANYTISDTMTIESVKLMTRADESSEIPATDTTLDGTKNYALEIIVKVADTVNNTIPDEMNESDISTKLLFEGLSRVIDIQSRDDRLGNVAIPLGVEKITRVNSGYDGDQHQARVRVYFKAKNQTAPITTSLDFSSNRFGQHNFGEDKDYVIILSGDIGLLEKISLGNEELTVGNQYTIENISATEHKIVFKGSYLKGLTEGEYPITISRVGDRPTIGSLKVAKAVQGSNVNVANPNTFDGVGIYYILLVGSALAIGTGIITLKRKNNL